MCVVVFFFNQKTADELRISDWSSDVCSSDLYATLRVTANAPGGHSSMPPAETGVTVLAKAVLAIADDPFPLELRGPGLSMIEALAAETGGTTARKSVV